jgi:flavin-dependent dehydrogenase
MVSHEMEQRRVLVIGAGPSGAIAAALLKRNGHDVLIIERQQFPRFSIGESLLAHCLDFVEEAGMLEAVEAASFQRKNGAAFAWGERRTHFDFREKFTEGKGWTFQVQRATFDKLLADQAELQGVEIRYQEEIIATDFGAKPTATVRRLDGSEYQVQADFVLDASGYGRVLPPARPRGAIGLPGAPGAVHPYRRLDRRCDLRPREDSGHHPPDHA